MTGCAGRRKALNLTQEQLADLVGCSPSAIRKFESDERRPSFQIAELLATHLEIPADQRPLFLRMARGEIQVEKYSSLNPLAEFEKLGGHLREADTLARTLADQRRLGWVSVYMAYFLWVTGRSAEAHAAAQSAQAIAETLRDVPLEVGGNFYVGAVGLTCGDYRQTEASFRNVVQLLEGDRARDRCGLTGFPAAMARGYLTWALAERGAFEEGIVHGQAGVRLADVLDHPFSWVVATWGPAHLYRIRGEFPHAARLLERALALCHERDLPHMSWITAGFLGSVYAVSGRVADGLSLLDDGLKAPARWQALMIAHLGEACLLPDRLDDALASAARALTLAGERGQRGYEAWVLHLLGEIASHGRLSSLKKKKPFLLGVAGCVAQVQKSDLFKKRLFVDFVIGPDNYLQLPAMIKNAAEAPSALTDWGRDWRELGADATARENAWSAFVPVMEGCDNFCAYCIVPFSRGREKFRPLPNIIAEARAAAGPQAADGREPFALRVDRRTVAGPTGDGFPRREDQDAAARGREGLQVPAALLHDPRARSIWRS